SLYFLQVEGGGEIELPNGQTITVDYADKNGHPFRPVGRRLAEAGAIKSSGVSVSAIRKWFGVHSDQLAPMLASDPSYVFFKIAERVTRHTLGAVGVPLTPQRSIAVDAQALPLGLPLWLDTTDPVHPSEPYRRLVLAQDTGTAIKGPL